MGDKKMKFRCTNPKCSMSLQDNQGMFEIRRHIIEAECGHCKSVAEALPDYVAIGGKDPFYPELTKNISDGNYFLLWKNQNGETFYEDKKNKKFIPYNRN